MAEREPQPQGQKPISEFGFKNAEERDAAVAVLKQIRDAGLGNENLTVLQILHILGLERIAESLSQNPVIASSNYLVPARQSELIGDPIPRRIPVEHEIKAPTAETQIPIVSFEPHTIEAQSPHTQPVQIHEDPATVQVKRNKRTLGVPRNASKPKPVSDGRRFRTPPTREMGTDPIARNVFQPTLPPPTRTPDAPKE